MATTIDTIRDDFEFLDNWEDRYRYVIELGRELEGIDERARTEANRVHGCVSQVWLQTIRHGDAADPVLEFRADSDAHIVKGLVAILLALFSGRKASEIVGIEAETVLADLGLDAHLSQQRSNGLRSMVQRIRREAHLALAPAAS
jgi:cysteine desulfuration protein SufE